MNPPIVSIIMPARNMAPWIGDAIRSVLAQTCADWELIVVENASTDETAAVVSAFEDPRIRLVRTTEAGMNKARNKGLDMASGSYICFLDADDLLPANSLWSRVALLDANPSCCFADGSVITVAEDGDKVLRHWSPTFRGVPLEEMARPAPGCFCGITWMIRHDVIGGHRFAEDWTHLEDRLFFLELADRGSYDFVDERTYTIRRRRGSVMSDLRGMEKGYVHFAGIVHRMGIRSAAGMKEDARAIHRMFVKAYIRAGQWSDALRHVGRSIFPGDRFR